MTLILDSSVVLAYLWGEPGSDEVADRIPGSAMSAVNYQEVVAKLADGGMSDDDIDRALGSIDLALHPHDAPQALAAGKMRRATRAAGLSLGDRACLALALALDAPVLTADRAWAGLDVGPRIELIR